jgi:hypothetical protein
VITRYHCGHGVVSPDGDSAFLRRSPRSGASCRFDSAVLVFFLYYNLLQGIFPGVDSRWEGIPLYKRLDASSSRDDFLVLFPLFSKQLLSFAGWLYRK